MLGWLKPLMRTRAWELRAASICLYRVSSTCFSQWGGLWQTPTITSPLLVLSYVLIRVNPNPYVLSSLLHPSADWAPHIPIDLSHIGQLLLLPLSFIKDKHSSMATLQSGDPSHRVSLVLTILVLQMDPGLSVLTPYTASTGTLERCLCMLSSWRGFGGLCCTQSYDSFWCNTAKAKDNWVINGISGWFNTIN